MLLTATRVSIYEKGATDMFDVARSIQEDRRHEADIQRIVSNLPRERSLSVGRYRVTVSKRSGRTLPAA
jgi:hypothetical protein